MVVSSRLFIKLKPGWYQMPEPEIVPPETTVWHYTTASGLLGMLKSNEIWATSASMLNDRMELLYGIEIMRSVWKDNRGREELSDETRRIIDSGIESGQSLLEKNGAFVLCASLEGDSLSQWRAYGGTLGYAVGIRAEDLAVVSESETLFEIIANRSPSWSKVVYSQSDHEELCEAVLQFMAICASEGASGDSALDPFMRSVPCVKHAGFIDEREVRFVIFGDAFATEAPETVRFRAGPLGVTPYVALSSRVDASGDRSMRPVIVPSKLPITSIRIGPCPYPDAARHGLRLALQAYGYSDVEVEASDVPFR